MKDHGFTVAAVSPMPIESIPEQARKIALWEGWEAGGGWPWPYKRKSRIDWYAKSGGVK